MFTRKLSRRQMLTMTAALALSPLLRPGEAAAAQRAGTTTTRITLSDQEKKDLLFMREEEKLARDVYLTLYDVWDTPVFANIAASEQRHMDAILGLLNTYKLPDPAASKVVGEFTNEELQKLYTDLIGMGKQSALDALQVGGLIEETDIYDLRVAMEAARLAKIDTVYANLLNGSYNHLRAFASKITAITGQPYEAQILDPGDVNEILN
jgi:hypothetical protein